MKAWILSIYLSIFSNGDGYLDVEEVKAWILSIYLSIFSNGDGYLDVEEVKAWIVPPDFDHRKSINQSLITVFEIKSFQHQK